ncbi:pirin family protein [Brevibacillus invocatus]|uniref:pirin family protein n=1 Tax=Brevibacillus invocatus TaxID=173959 RepID=UPI00203CB9C4|nr:pirin family protein [Brevibacillus invocatus]MCM3079357.1 pirin family protein [Brevibacillus invocatus]MCM3429453.1 pirin family protein [Brevibacillus invocatus]
MDIRVYTQNEQANGHFGDGEIVENKPIGFPREGSVVSRVGPLFYWAWAKSLKTFEIPFHPHSGFEILSYVLNGTVGHKDTLGNWQKVTTGGVQIMQTGSGAHHAEELGKDTEIFQIWFEPHLSQATKRPPTYNQYDHEEFPVEHAGSVSVKQMIGANAPIEVVADVKMQDVRIPAGAIYSLSLPAGYAHAVVVVEGSGVVSEAGKEDAIGAAAQKGDFVVISTEVDHCVTYQANSDEDFRLVLIEVPTEVDYPLYRK